METQRLSQVLLSVAGVIDCHLFLSCACPPVFSTPGISVRIRYPHSFLSGNLCLTKAFAHRLIQAFSLGSINLGSINCELPSSPTTLQMYSVICKQAFRYVRNGETLWPASPLQAPCFSSRPGGDLPTLLRIPKSIEPRPLLSPTLLKLFNLIGLL